MRCLDTTRSALARAPGQRGGVSAREVCKVVRATLQTLCWHQIPRTDRWHLALALIAAPRTAAARKRRVARGPHIAAVTASLRQGGDYRQRRHHTTRRLGRASGPAATHLNIINTLIT